MDLQEEKDLAEMRSAMQHTKDACFSYLGTIDTANETTLKYMGYEGKTNAEAMQLAYRSYKRQLDKLVQNHVKKYPDR